jgi:hypothetical protein
MDLLNTQVIQETNTRDALMKMNNVYEANPSMGDPNSVNGQLIENRNTMDRLVDELNRLRVISPTHSSQFHFSSKNIEKTP